MKGISLIIHFRAKLQVIQLQRYDLLAAFEFISNVKKIGNENILMIIIDMHRLTSDAECVDLRRPCRIACTAWDVQRYFIFNSIGAVRQYWHLLFLVYQIYIFKDE